MYKHTGWLSVSGEVRWWVSHSRGGPLVSPQLQDDANWWTHPVHI